LLDPVVMYGIYLFIFGCCFLSVKP